MKRTFDKIIYIYNILFCFGFFGFFLHIYNFQRGMLLNILYIYYNTGTKYTN